MTVMRSVYYVPGNKEDLIAQTPNIPADVITLDAETAVPVAEKEKARGLIHKNLKFAASGGADVCVRINGWDTGMTNTDCETIVDEGLLAVCLAKCGGPDDVRRLDWKLTEIEQKKSLEKGSVKIQLLIETAKGMMNVYQSALASQRVNALIFGAVDYTLDMKIPLIQPLGENQCWTKARLACTARATGVAAIDSAYTAFKDITGFEKDTAYGQRLGFEGRVLIHPNQIEPCHQIYTPAPDMVKWAKEIAKVFEKEGIAKGSAAVSHKGHMVDTPVYLGARRILETMAEIAAREEKHS